VMFVGFDRASFIYLINVSQRDDTVDGIYLYFITLHVSGICPSSGVYLRKLQYVISVYRLYVWGTSSFTLLWGCGSVVS
jgi:hypothetical protein